jgi:hypothetical protein
MRTFIQITSILLTLESAIFLAKGSLGLSPQAIAELSTTPWDYNPGLINNLAQQRADNAVGVLFLIVAIALQLWDIFRPARQEDFPIHRRAAAIAVISSAVLFLVAWTSAGALARSTERTALSIAKARPVPPQAADALSDLQALSLRCDAWSVRGAERLGAAECIAGAD